ncbi:MAG: DoxX family protein [Cyclobacteriaceae bacterium]
MKIAYWIATSLLCLVIGYSAYLYLFHHSAVIGIYQRLGFPPWMIYPSAIAKILAIIAILFKVSNFLKEWAYAGIFFDVTMAFTAHTMAQDGGGILSIIGIVAVVVAYYLDGKLFGNAAFSKE